MRSSSLRQNYTTTKVLRQTISEIQGILNNYKNILFIGSFGIEIETNSTKADIDNIAKGIIDALQGFAYTNDKACQEICVKRVCDSKNT
jgi:hypothetical protein